MSRARGRAKAAAPRVLPRTEPGLPGDVAALIEAGQLPSSGVEVRVRYPGVRAHMRGTLDGYVHVDGRLHLRLARAEAGVDGQVRAIRRLIAWSSVESVSWDVPPSPRDLAAPYPSARLAADAGAWDGGHGACDTVSCDAPASVVLSSAPPGPYAARRAACLDCADALLARGLWAVAS